MNKPQNSANTRRKIFFINLLPIILITLNLRAPITSIAPVVDSVREYYALNAALAGLLTSLPLLAFGLVSFVVSYFQPVRAMFVGLLCILLGEIVRCVGGSAELFIGTAIMGSGIAVANVLLPSLVKAKFPRQIPKIMGIYSLVLNFSAMLGVLPSARRIYLIIFICGAYIVCFALLLLSQQVWVVLIVSVLIGVPVGGVFGIALLFISTKSANVQTATKLSAMAQGVGYLIAALSPVVIGKIYDHFHSFTYALVGLLGLAILLNYIGYLAYKSPQI